MSDDRFAIAACGHCGEPGLRAALVPCPFLPQEHGLCATCLPETAAVYRSCVTPKVAKRRKATAR